jgi:hypothetical protein
MRDQIEKLVRPIDTVRSNKKIEKEYLWAKLAIKP